MSEHGYETGRLNLPFVGHCTFGKQPACLDWGAIEADIAVLGAPFDFGTQYRAGARFGGSRRIVPQRIMLLIRRILRISACERTKSSRSFSRSSGVC